MVLPCTPRDPAGAGVAMHQQVLAGAGSDDIGGEGPMGVNGSVDTNVTAVIRVVDQETIKKGNEEQGNAPTGECIQDVDNINACSAHQTGVCSILTETTKENEIDGSLNAKKRRKAGDDGMGSKKKMYPNKSSKANSGKADGSFTSQYRGVTKHRLTQRFEAHFWDSTYQRPNPRGKRSRGRQVYLGGYLAEEDAARAYDKAAIAYLGLKASLNFPFAEYQDYLAAIRGKSAEEVIADLRRESVGFARGSSQYRGVTKNKKCLRWEARIGKVVGNKYLYLGIFDDPKLAAIAYDKAAVKFFGKKAMTNFRLEDYQSILDNPDSHFVSLQGEGCDLADHKQVDAKKKDSQQNASGQTATHGRPTNQTAHLHHVMHKMPENLQSMYHGTLPPQNYQEQLAWYQNQLRLLQAPQHQIHSMHTAKSHQQVTVPQPYATMTFDFDGNTSGNPHQQQYVDNSTLQRGSAIDISQLSPLAASLLSPLGIPKDSSLERKGTHAENQRDYKIDSASGDALKAMSDPSASPFTQNYNAQGALDLDGLGWIDNVDLDQIAMMLKAVSSPKP